MTTATTTFRVFNKLRDGGDGPWGTMVGTRDEVVRFLRTALELKENQADSTSFQYAWQRLDAFARGGDRADIEMARWNRGRPAAHFTVRPYVPVDEPDDY